MVKSTTIPFSQSSKACLISSLISDIPSQKLMLFSLTIYVYRINHIISVLKMIIHSLLFLTFLCFLFHSTTSIRRQSLRTLFHGLRIVSQNPNDSNRNPGISESAAKISQPNSPLAVRQLLDKYGLIGLHGHRFISSNAVVGLKGSNHGLASAGNTVTIPEEYPVQFQEYLSNLSTLKKYYDIMNRDINQGKIPFQHGKSDEIQIRIQFPYFNSLEDELKEVGRKVAKIMEKMMDIPVKMDFGGDQNHSEKGHKLVKNVELNGHDLITRLSDQNISPNHIDMGKVLIREICGGSDCDVHMELPEFRVDPCSVKPEPGDDELDRALRPMLLKLAAKWQIGRLWVDNPNMEYRNIFEIAYEMAPGVLKNERHLIERHLKHIELNSPFFFRRIDGSLRNIENDHRAIKWEDREKFKHRIQFYVHDGESDAPNGLQRNQNLQIVKINVKLLNDGRHIYKLMQKVLGVDCGQGLRILYDRRDKYMHDSRQQFAQLNAAYGGENFSMIGGPQLLSPDRKRVLDRCESSFWTDYANFETGKYEIPLVYDASFVQQAEEHKELLEYVFKTFEEKSVIKFVVYAEPPGGKDYARIYGAKNDYAASAHTGYLDKNIFWKEENYSGQIVEFGKKQMTKYSLFHELLHTCGLSHEHQRADVEEFVDYEPEYIKKLCGRSDDDIVTNFAVRKNYLPVNRYNPTSIMHYTYEKMKPIWAGPEWVKKLQEWDNVPDVPNHLDWENLNHFYGVGRGRTKFKVENGKIVDDIDGQRRLRKK